MLAISSIPLFLVNILKFYRKRKIIKLLADARGINNKGIFINKRAHKYLSCKLKIKLIEKLIKSNATIYKTSIEPIQIQPVQIN